MGRSGTALTNVDPRWTRIARDSLYDTALDTLRLMSPYYLVCIVRYRTDHAIPHLYKGEEFNREMVVSYLRCGRSRISRLQGRHVDARAWHGRPAAF